MTQTAEILELVKAPALYSEFTNQLAQLKANNKVVFEYATPAGNKSARSHIASMRTVKGNLERARVAAKATALEYGRFVDSKAGEIKVELEAMISLHEVPLLEIENKEKARVDYHRRMVQGIIDCGIGLIGGSPQPYAIIMRELEEKIIVDSTWEEFENEAHRAKAESLQKVKATHEEACRQSEMIADLARLRAESEARAKLDREANIAREAAERATREADTRAQHEADRVKFFEQEREREVLEATRKQELELAQSKQREAEAIAQAANAVKNAKIQAEKDLLAKQAAEKADADKREANKKHHAKINNEACEALRNAGLSHVDAQFAVTAIAKGEVPHIRISY